MKRRTDVHLKQAKQKETKSVSRRESQKFNEKFGDTATKVEDASEPLTSPTHPRPTARSFAFPS